MTSSVCNGYGKAQIVCNKQDLEKSKILAERKHPAAVAYFNWSESFVDKSEKEIQNYISIHKKENTESAYKKILQAYKYLEDKNSYCEIFHDGYNKFGIPFVAVELQAYNVLDKIKIKCIDTEPEKFLRQIDTDEAQLLFAMMQAFKKTKDSDNASRQIFEKLYNNSKNHAVKYNAGYCLGSILYNANKELGIKLIKESIANGYLVYVGQSDLDDINIFSDHKRIINIGQDWCSLYRNRVY